MRHLDELAFMAMLVCILATTLWAKDANRELGPIETLIVEPLQNETVCVWVPADKCGPVINFSCQPKRGCQYTSSLPAHIDHAKDESSPSELARILAEYVAIHHGKSLPLTIFNGWQWESSFSLSEFETATYALPRRGGSWESSWEAKLSVTSGAAFSQWVGLDMNMGMWMATRDGHV